MENNQTKIEDEREHEKVIKSTIPTELTHLFKDEHTAFTGTSSLLGDLQSSSLMPVEKVKTFMDPLPETRAAIITFSKNIFCEGRVDIRHSITMCGTSKSKILLIQKNVDKVQDDVKICAAGPPHGPVFTAQVTLQLKEYANVTLQTQGLAQKKQAEVQAFHKLLRLLIR